MAYTPAYTPAGWTISSPRPVNKTSASHPQGGKPVSSSSSGLSRDFAQTGCIPWQESSHPRYLPRPWDSASSASSRGHKAPAYTHTMYDPSSPPSLPSNEPGPRPGNHEHVSHTSGGAGYGYNDSSTASYSGHTHLCPHPHANSHPHPHPHPTHAHPPNGYPSSRTGPQRGHGHESLFLNMDTDFILYPSYEEAEPNPHSKHTGAYHPRAPNPSHPHPPNTPKIPRLPTPRLLDEQWEEDGDGEGFVIGPVMEGMFPDF